MKNIENLNQDDKDFIQKVIFQRCNKFKQYSSDKIYLFDLYLIILNGATRDLNVLKVILGDTNLHYLRDKRRIIIGINQVDMEMSGRYWDYTNNLPEDKLKKYIKGKEEYILEFIHSLSYSYKEKINEESIVSFSSKYNYNIGNVWETLLKKLECFTYAHD